MTAFLRSLFLPLSWKNVTLLRLGITAFALFAYWPRGLHLGFVPWFQDEATLPLLERVYAAVFIQPWYWAICMGALILFGLGLLPRWLTWLPLPLLLPLGFLNSGVQSRFVLIMVLLCLALWPSFPFWKARGRDQAGIPGPPRWPVVLITWQLSLVYLANAVAKLVNPEYLSGDVLEGLSQYHGKFNIVIDHGIAYLPFLAIPAWLAALASIATEAGIGLGVWVQRPLHRVIIWVFAAAFHLFLMEVMSIFMLNIACLVVMALVFLLDRPATAE